jgi:hypothetical protein
VESIKNKVRKLAEQGEGRTKILRAVPQASEWLVKNIIKEVKGQGLVKAAKHEDVVRDLSPIQINLPKAPSVKKNLDELPTHIIFGDVQAPYHCERSIDLLCQIIKDQKDIRLDSVVDLGDFNDFYTVSKYDKNPLRRNQLQDELIEGARVRAKISEAANGVKRFFIPGNHEGRLQKYISNRAPALAALPQLSLENILGLKSSGWELVDSYLLLNDDFVVKHGDVVSSQSGMTARKEMDASWTSGASGHTHRLGVHYRTPLFSAVKGLPPKVWIETGCLCLPDQEYMSGKHGDWQQGFVVVRFGPDGNVFPELVSIYNGRTVFRGKVYESE